jgi:hypothetical protein
MRFGLRLAVMAGVMTSFALAGTVEMSKREEFKRQLSADAAYREYDAY